MTNSSVRRDRTLGGKPNRPKKDDTLMGLRVGVFAPPTLNPEQFACLDSWGSTSTQCWIGGVVDREHRRLSSAHPKRAMILVDVPFTDLMLLPRDMWSPLSAPPTYEWTLEQILPGNAPLPAGAGGLIFVSIDIDPAVEEEFNEWNDAEHVPHLLQVPGVIGARRFRAQSGSPKYVALYHVTAPAVYADPVWLSANETPWTHRLSRYRFGVLHWIFEPWSEAGGGRRSTLKG